MSDNDAASPVSSNGLPSPGLSQVDKVLGEVHVQADGDIPRSSTASPLPHTKAINGHILNGVDHSDDATDSVAKLRAELVRANEEKNTWIAKYRDLVGRVTAMKTNLGTKLKQDAEELDRREQVIQQLTVQNEDLSQTIETLKEELITSNEEVERTSKELDTMRSRVLQDNAQENIIRERELREAQTEIERLRLEKDEWERVALEERSAVEELRASVETLQRDLELEREAREREAESLESETVKVNNLQAVLQDFQTAKEHELRQAVKEYETKLNNTTQSLAEYKSRALTAEAQLDESKTNISRTKELEKEVKEKTLLVDKLRHEAIILNDHLVEALRRLRRNSNETNVDRRLVTNVLLSFLTTPRADAKRFEMLSLLATILMWSDAEREKAGLQRGSLSSSSSASSTGQLAATASSGSSFWGRSNSSSNSGSPAKGAAAADLSKTDETESFSRLWVEFLLTEAASGEKQRTPPPPSQSRSLSNTSMPGSPTYPSSPTAKTRRLGSFASSSGNSDTNIPHLSSPPPGKDKNKEPIGGNT